MHNETAFARMRVGKTSLYKSQGTGPAPAEKNKTYNGKQINATVASGSCLSIVADEEEEEELTISTSSINKPISLSGKSSHINDFVVNDEYEDC